MKALLLTALVTLVQLPSTPPVKMGLWEVESVTKISMPNMPAGMPGMGPRTIKLRSCMTPESYTKYLGASQQQRDCVRTNEVWSAHGYKFDMACNKGSLTGHVDITFDSSEQNHATTHMTSSGAQGVNVEATSVSRFISTDCGNVSPDKPEFIR